MLHCDAINGQYKLLTGQHCCTVYVASRGNQQHLFYDVLRVLVTFHRCQLGHSWLCTDNNLPIHCLFVPSLYWSIVNHKYAFVHMTSVEVWRLGKVGGKLVMVCIWTVSYTHLDVYKRQVLVYQVRSHHFCRSLLFIF